MRERRARGFVVKSAPPRRLRQVTQRFAVDAGPLVALLSVHDHYHAWGKSAFSCVTPPIVTCEAVLAEAWHLLRGTANGQTALLELITAGTVVIKFALIAELAAV